MRYYHSLIAAATAALFFLPQAAFAAPSQVLPPDQRTLPGRPSFPQKLTQEINKKAIQAVHFQYAPAYDTPLSAVDAAPESITILGQAEATQEQMVAFINRRNPMPKLNCSVKDIVRYYYEEASLEGVRPDVALCQALKETGFFAYGGDVSPQQNNFCGLGATGNHEPGYSFDTPQLGVRAHIQHLLVYTQYERPKQKLVDPRYTHVVNNRPDLHGKVHHWTKLNGAWAVPGKNYGQEILMLWREAQSPDSSAISLTAAQQKVAAQPGSASAYIYRGLVYYQQGNYNDAQRDFDAAVKLVPTTSEGLYNSAITAAKRGQPKTARQTYDKLLKLQPDFTQAYYNRALIHYQARDYNEAITDLQRLLAIESRQVDAQNLIGLCHIAQKKYDEAWQDFAAAAAINSANMNVLANQFIFMACLK